MRRVLLGGALALAALAARAETLYVIDRIDIGVHETTELDSVILEIVSTGTPLTVLRREGELVRVRTPDGNEGWVDGGYLVESEPARESVGDLQQRLSETARDLGAARAEVEVLRQRLAEARQLGGAGQSEAGTGASDQTVRETNETSGRLGEALDELAALAEKNQRLEQRIAELEGMRAAAEAEREQQRLELARATAEMATADPAPAPAAAPGAGPENPVLGAWRPWGVWHWLLFVSLLALAGALGAYAVDWAARRRHGGFRIR
ncbi:MAG: TIGR04211 family SH3 domain-containing protein [Gammaproteobacteria bacterium]|nr:TIGR04211 family SH3 domain-containing protein [Gammaproteobacteria bacterium]